MKVASDARANVESCRRIENKFRLEEAADHVHQEWQRTHRLYLLQALCSRHTRIEQLELKCGTRTRRTHASVPKTRRPPSPDYSLVPTLAQVTATKSFQERSGANTPTHNRLGLTYGLLPQKDSRVSARLKRAKEAYHSEDKYMHSDYRGLIQADYGEALASLKRRQNKSCVASEEHTNDSMLPIQMMHTAPRLGSSSVGRGHHKPTITQLHFPLPSHLNSEAVHKEAIRSKLDSMLGATASAGTYYRATRIPEETHIRSVGPEEQAERRVSRRFTSS
jgi:hypothetical protein